MSAGDRNLSGSPFARSPLRKSPPPTPPRCGFGVIRRGSVCTCPFDDRDGSYESAPSSWTDDPFDKRDDRDGPADRDDPFDDPFDDRRASFDDSDEAVSFPSPLSPAVGRSVGASIMPVDEF